MQQEPRLTAFLGNDEKMITAFQHGKDIYATIAAASFNMPYEKCLEFHPETHEYQPDGKARRTEAKSILLGVTYGRSIPSIADQLYGKRNDMTDEQKVKSAQKVYDAVIAAFSGLRDLMITSQEFAKKHGYVETMLGRRRHIPDMQLPEFEFKAMTGYVNPDVDPLNVETLNQVSDIPQRIIDKLTKEFASYKYFGQIAKRTKELREEKIKVINNRPKINDAIRQCLNCVDFDTEILTTSGWKTYDQVNIGDEILTFDMKSRNIVKSSISDVHIYNQDTEVVEFKSPSFHALSTPDHRWVCCDSKEDPKFRYTHNIEKNKWPDYPILRIADNNFEANLEFNDDQLRIIGWLLADGGFTTKPYCMQLYQSTKREKNKFVLQKMKDTLDRLNMVYSDNCYDGVYHTLYLNKCDFTCKLMDMFPNKELTFEFVSTLSEHQADILMWSMIEGDGTLGETDCITLTCSNTSKRDVFQYLCTIAGYATNSYVTTADQANNWTAGKMYNSISNKAPIVVHDDYYTITVLKITRAQIYPHHKSRTTVPGVWCVTTPEETWIARRSGKVFITGNSRVQGSAADMTKLALLNILRNDEFKQLGARVLVPVHDEILIEAPKEHAERAGELLSTLMSSAGDFLPFTISCDVECSYRWYGLSHPCPYVQPDNMENLSEDDIKWIQYHLVECEYILPIFPDENGDKPRGDAAHGINGIDSEEFRNAISHYMNRYKLTQENFIDHIKTKVVSGSIK